MLIIKISNNFADFFDSINGFLIHQTINLTSNYNLQAKTQQWTPTQAKAAHGKFIGFMSFENIVIINRPFLKLKLEYYLRNIARVKSNF